MTSESRMAESPFSDRLSQLMSHVKDGYITLEGALNEMRDFRLKRIS